MDYVLFAVPYVVYFNHSFVDQLFAFFLFVYFRR